MKNPKILSLLIILINLFSLSSVASTNCTKLVSSFLKSRPKVSVIAPEGISKDSYKKRYFDLLDFAEDSGLKIPTVKAQIEIVEDRAAYLLHRRDQVTISVPYQRRKQDYRNARRDSYKDFTKHPKFTLPVFDHEVGHAIFRNNIPTESKLYKKRMQFEDEEMNLSLKGLKLVEQHEKTTDEVLKAELELKMSEIKERFSEIKKYYGSIEYAYYKSYFVAMDELFADLTAVMMAKDPSAVRKVSLHTKQVKSGPSDKLDAFWYDDTIYRDFAHPNNEISIWRVDGAVHNLLAPVRYALFEKYLKMPYYLEGEGRTKLYKAVLDASINVSNQLDHENSVDINEVNELIINEIDNILEIL